ncbi:hypothetical protein Daura_14730 [Dactylosporangium aurantiacum]|uniref:Uncharacterized protein n=2 Tax=Dactylosporangium aurantiacum TaxID=35754 RepID=A0A9Q9INX0_9ACTN|nr:hypothetical protein [Dactylosporangium aurantiacum]UWZ57187.1 hypothetical protein Daura_14055 [Dactylosporangium aurantiacum]UWZ57307.1 hypothetical protein Daura_14730 [Dactylosporangium aurantiacum]
MSEYGEIETGEQHAEIDQLHQVDASQEDYQSQFGVYEADHASAESTSFDQGHSVEFTGADGSHYAEQDYTSYDHSAAETDHVFAAEGQESYSATEFSQIDALRAQLDTAFASATQLTAN